MKFKEDHIIIALVILIILVIWSKFMMSSGYAPGQGNSPAIQPTLININADIQIAKWMSTSSSGDITGDTGTARGFALVSSAVADFKLQPGDLNRQLWAQTTVTISSTSVSIGSTCQPIGFRKQLQSGGGGPVWYLYSYSGQLPTNADYKQDQSAGTLATINGFTVPQFVIFQKSVLSPFLDGGCSYRIANTGTCSITGTDKCGQTGTQVQTLQLIKTYTGNVDCLGPDGVSKLNTSGTAVNIAGSTSLISNAATNANSQSTPAPVAGTTYAYFSNTATAGSNVFYAASCVPSGCSSVNTGFLQNSGTVTTIAGTVGSDSTYNLSGSSIFAQDGVASGGSIALNLPGASFSLPTFIAVGGSGNLTNSSNVIVSNVLCGTSGSTSTSISVRNVWRETTDSPPLWQVSTISVSVTLGTAAVNCTGLAVDRNQPPNIYLADSGNGKIFKFTTGGTLVATWAGFNTLKGIYLDASAGTPNGNNVFALVGTSMFIIPVGSTNINSIAANSNGVTSVTGLSGTPGHLVCSGTSASGGGTCYYSDVSTPSNTQIYKFTIPAATSFANGTVALSGATAPAAYAGGGGTAGATGAKGTGNINGSGQLIIDSNNNLYVANPGNNTISKIDTNGNILQFTGGNQAQNTAGSAGSTDSGLTVGAAGTPGGGAMFNGPKGLTISPDGITMFVADTGNSTVRIIV